MATRVCDIDGCDKPHMARGFCNTHYRKHLRTLDRGKTCSVAGCDRPVQAKQLCNTHYYRQYRGYDLGPIKPYTTPIPDEKREELTTQGKKWCYGCKSALCLDRFRSDSKADDGLYCQCRSCEAKYSASVRERQTENYRRWCQENPDKAREHSRRRRARKAAATVEDFTTEELHDYWRSNDIDPNRCWYCSAPAEHVDHFFPLSKGGTHSRDNLVPACVYHNCSKHARSPWDFIRPMVGRTMVLFTTTGPEITLYRKEEHAA